MEKILVKNILVYSTYRSASIKYSSQGISNISLEDKSELVSFLEKQGFRVDHVLTASDAYGSLKDNPYDLFISAYSGAPGTLRTKGTLRARPRGVCLKILQKIGKTKGLEDLPVIITIATKPSSPSTQDRLRKYGNVKAIFEEPFLSDSIMDYIKLKK